MALPEKIWAGKSLPPPDELAVRTWEPDSAPDFKLWEPTLFIRADLVDELVKALEEAREDLAMAAAPAFKDPQYGDEVERLGERIGYGALMSSASASWRESAARKGYPPGGEFTVGPCVATAIYAIKMIDAALTRIKGDGK